MTTQATSALGIGLLPTMYGTNNQLTPERRAIERIRRKATGMAIDVATEVSLAHEVDVRPNLEPDSVWLPRAGSCRCAYAEVNAYREDGEWICHTCGHELSPNGCGPLTLRTRRDEDQ